jgi:uncharacterized protein (TIGR00730 family)
MKTSNRNLNDRTLADAWADLQAHAESGLPLDAAAFRLAFADPEFLLRRETRGIRFQLEFLKPDLEQQEQGVNYTVVVFGSARFLSPQAAQAQYDTALNGSDPATLKLATRNLRNSSYYQAAQDFAHLVAKHSQKMTAQERLFICTGGGPGVMEAANRGAHEAGALNVGLNIALPNELSHNPYISPTLSFKFHYFALRKMHFMIRAKALVAFPGGFGTLDELFEILTLIQTKKVEPVPVVLFGKDYWSRLVNFPMLVEEGLISHEDLELFSLVDTPQAAWDVIKNFYRLSPLKCND